MPEVASLLSAKYSIEDENNMGFLTLHFPQSILGRKNSVLLGPTHKEPADPPVIPVC